MGRTAFWLALAAICVAFAASLFGAAPAYAITPTGGYICPSHGCLICQGATKPPCDASCQSFYGENSQYVPDTADYDWCNTSPPAVNGACGMANGNIYASAPHSASALCATGTASAVSGSGPWNWTCSGANGGSPASCSSAKCVPTAPATGSCSWSQHGCSGSLIQILSGATVTVDGATLGVPTASDIAACTNLGGSCIQAEVVDGRGEGYTGMYRLYCYSGTATAAYQMINGSGSFACTVGGGSASSTASCDNTMRGVEAAGPWYTIARPLGSANGTYDSTSSLKAYVDAVCGANSYMAAEWTYSNGKCNANFCAILSCQLAADASFNILDRTGCISLN